MFELFSIFGLSCGNIELCHGHFVVNVGFGACKLKHKHGAKENSCKKSWWCCLGNTKEDTHPKGTRSRGF